MSDKICCGHEWNEHGLFGCNHTVADNWMYGKRSVCKCKVTRKELGLMLERDEARAIARKFYRERNEARRTTKAVLQLEDWIHRIIEDEAVSQLAEARAWAIYWRKMYDAQLRQNANLDCKVYIAEDERSEAVRDLVDAENEIKRLRLLILNIWEMGDIELPRVSNNFGCATCAWCSECGGDVVVVEHGKFQCAECGK